MLRSRIVRADQGLDELAKRFEHWRTTRASSREPIPQPLWDEAAQLSRRLPISWVARRLRLSAGELKRRREGTVRPVSMSPALAEPPATFVPVVTPGDTAAPGADIEVHRADGTRLRIRYSADAPVAEVLRAFLAG